MELKSPLTSDVNERSVPSDDRGGRGDVGEAQAHGTVKSADEAQAR